MYKDTRDDERASVNKLSVNQRLRYRAAEYTARIRNNEEK